MQKFVHELPRPRYFADCQFKILSSRQQFKGRLEILPWWKTELPCCTLNDIYWNIKIICGRERGRANVKTNEDISTFLMAAVGVGSLIWQKCDKATVERNMSFKLLCDILGYEEMQAWLEWKEKVEHKFILCGWVLCVLVSR